MANTLMSLLVSIGVDTSDLVKGLGSAEKSALGFAGKMEKIGGQMQKVGGALTVGLTLPIAAFGASSVQSAMDAESALADLEATIKSTGGAAGMTLDELTKMATELQKTTKFSDEAIMGGQGMLLTFTKIGKDVFPDATMAMLNMAEKFGSVEAASIQLGKALNDPIAGVSALRKVGVSLTEEQEAQIKQFMAVGDVASAQKVILGELAVEFGGLAEAAGATNAGKLEQFKNQLDDMKETIGTALIPTLLRLMDAITPLIEKFANATPAQQNFVIALVGIVAAAGPVITVIGSIVSAFGTLISWGGSVISFFASFGAFIVGTLIPAISAIALPLAIVVATVYLVYLAFKKNFGGITTTVKQLWFIIKYAIGKIVEAFKKAFPGASAALEKFSAKAKEVIDTIKKGFSDIGAWIKENNPFASLNDGVKGGKSLTSTATTAQEITTSMSGVTESAEEVEARLAAMTEKNQTFISSLERYADFSKNYANQHKGAVQGVTEAQNALNEAVIKYGVDSKQAYEAEENLASAKLGLQELEASWHESTQRMVYDMVQTQFMADGVLTQVEADALVAFGIQSGFFTQEQAQYTQLLLDQANAFVEATHNTEQLSGTTQNLIGTVYQLADAYKKAAQNQSAITQKNLGEKGTMVPAGSPNKAFGGSVLAGNAYTVGEHGPETFVPRTNGTIIPTGKGGSGTQNIYVTVHNPKAVTSEESVRKELMKLAYLGAA